MTSKFVRLNLKILIPVQESKIKTAKTGVGQTLAVDRPVQ